MVELKEVGKDILKNVYADRSEESHKGDYGRLLIIGGSERYTGAPLFNCRAAVNAMTGYRSGADLVTVIAVENVIDKTSRFAPELMNVSLKGAKLNTSHLETLLAEAEKHDVFVIGGGLGRGEETMEAIRQFLRSVDIPGVIDADAIHAVRGSGIDLSNFIITPHSYEFSVLSGTDPDSDTHSRALQVQKEAERLNTVILLKGHVDVISDGSDVLLNRTGTPYMTVGGTGDVLVGVIGSLLAQNNSGLMSAAAGSYINGNAAENTGRKRSLIPSDLLQEISSIVDSV